VRHVLALRDKSKQLHGAAGLAKTQPGRTTMPSTVRIPMDGLSHGIPEQSAFWYQSKEIIGHLYLAFIPAKMLLVSIHGRN